jgi:hypothetical protein
MSGFVGLSSVLRRYALSGPSRVRGRSPSRGAMNPRARSSAQPFMGVSAVVQLDDLEREVHGRMDECRAWVKRIVDVLYAVGMEPRATTWLVVEEAFREGVIHDPHPLQTRRRLNSPQEWDRFLEGDHASLTDFQQVLPELCGYWRRAQGRGLLPELPEIPVQLLAMRPASIEPATRKPADVKRYVRRIRDLMVDMLVEQPDVDLIGPGARGLLADRAGIQPNTLSGWFTGSGTTLKPVMRQVHAEAVAEAARIRDGARRRRTA